MRVAANRGTRPLLSMSLLLPSLLLSFLSLAMSATSPASHDSALCLWPPCEEFCAAQNDRLTVWSSRRNQCIEPVLPVQFSQPTIPSLGPSHAGSGGAADDGDRSASNATLGNTTRLEFVESNNYRPPIKFSMALLLSPLGLTVMLVLGVVLTSIVVHCCCRRRKRRRGSCDLEAARRAEYEKMLPAVRQRLHAASSGGADGDAAAHALLQQLRRQRRWPRRRLLLQRLLPFHVLPPCRKRKARQQATPRRQARQASYPGRAVARGPAAP